MILLKGVTHVERLMLLLTRELDRHGLRINQKKVELWTNKELQKYRCRSIQKIFAKKGDNQEKTKIRKFTDSYLSIPTKKLRETWNDGYPLLNRLLWAKLETLPKSQFERLLVRFTDKDYLYRADFEKLTRIEELNRKRRKPAPLVKRLSEMGAICEHNAFHFEVLAFARNTKKKALAARFRKRITEIEKLMAHNIV
jgi:hypothetical protein